MKWRRLLAVSVLGVALSACAKESDVDKYVNQRLGPYLQKLADAVCQLEVQNPTGLDPNKRACKVGPGDTTPPPKYPPS
jgi:hypothetical protein